MKYNPDINSQFAEIKKFKEQNALQQMAVYLIDNIDILPANTEKKWPNQHQRLLDLEEKFFELMEKYALQVEQIEFT